jgi:hypothetical protein
MEPPARFAQPPASLARIGTPLSDFTADAARNRSAVASGRPSFAEDTSLVALDHIVDAIRIGPPVGQSVGALNTGSFVEPPDQFFALAGNDLTLR